jgi:hypothetical protein
MQPKTKTATRAALAAVTESNPVAAKPNRFAAFIEAARRSVNDTLEGLMEEFRETGLPKEKHFLIEVLQTWESTSSRRGVKAYAQQEVPLFSAIQYQLDGMSLIPVASSAMVREVEQFITDKIAAGWKEPKTNLSPSPRETDQEIRDRIAKVVARQMQLFASHCKRSDLIFMSDLLEQWESLTDNPEFWKNTEYPLAAAAEVEIDTLRRRDEMLRKYAIERNAA